MTADTLDPTTELAVKLLALHDGFLAGADVDEAAARRLHHAACFGVAAYEANLISVAGPGTMLRALLLALIDINHPDLDYLRAGNVKGNVQ